MAIESSTYIADWVTANPASTDPKSEGDDHIRKIKTDIQTTFPGLAGRLRRITARSAAYTAVLNDNTSIIRASSTWTLSLTAAATLGNGWEILVYNDGAGTITVDPNGTETINGATTLTIAANTFVWISCNGTLFLATGAPTNSVNLSTTDTAQTVSAVKTFTADPVIQSTDAGAAAGPLLNIDRNSASPAAADVLGAIPFKGRDSGAGTDTYAQIQAEIVDPTAASEDGELAFLTAVAGALAKRGFLRNGLVIGSPTGGDQGAGTLNATGLYVNAIPFQATWSTFTPTVTLGGAGTVPQYTITTGRYVRIGNTVFVDVDMTGDGGNEGAGAVQISIDLPIAASASMPAAGAFPVGTAVNSTSEFMLYGVVAASATTINLSYFSAITTRVSFDAALQSNTTRRIRLMFFYEV